MGTARGHWIIALALLGSVARAGAQDRPLVTISRDSLTPARLEIDVGDVVRWTARGGERLRIELDPHPDGHEVIERAGSIQAIFLKPGEHGYSGTLAGPGGRVMRGVVVVRDARASEAPATCGPESSQRVCFAP